MTDGSTYKSRTHTSTFGLGASGASNPHAPSLSGFSFRSIGKQPDLLKRMHDGTPGDNGGNRYSPSPSPDLEEALIPGSESSPEDDSDGRRQPQSNRRIRLIDALAPGEDVNMDDMYVDDDYVNPVGVSLGPKEAQTASGTNKMDLRLQLRPTSTVQPNGNAISGNSNDTKAGVGKFSTAQQSFAKPINGNTEGIPTHFPIHNFHVPPIPPSEDISIPSGSDTTGIRYDSLQDIRRRLHSLTQVDAANHEDFKEIRALAQAAKVESTSISIATQKATSLSQKTLACAQEAMQASQECVEISRNAKKRWEATIQGCERFVSDQTKKRAEYQNAIEKELAALENSIKLLEEADQRHVRQAQQDAQDQKRIQQISAETLNQAATNTPPPRISVPAPSSSPQASTDDDSITSAYMLALAQQVQHTTAEFDRISRELEELRKIASGRNAENTQMTQEHGSGAYQPPAEQSTHRKLLGEALENKLESNTSNQVQSTASAKTGALSTLDPNAAPFQRAKARPTNLQQRPETSLTAQINQATASTETAATTPTESKHKVPPKTSQAVAAQVEDPKPPAHILPISPAASTQSLTSFVTAELEYPSVPKSSAPTPSSKLKSHLYVVPQPNLVCANANVQRSPHSTIQPSEDMDDSPIHLQGSGPGNLPVIFTEDDAQGHVQQMSLASEERWRLATNLPAIKEEPSEASIPSPAVVQRPILESVVTIALPEPSPMDTTNSAFSTPTTPTAARTARKRGKNRSGQQQPQQTGANPVSIPPTSAQLPQRPAHMAAVQAGSQPPEVLQQAPVAGNLQQNSAASQDKLRDVAQVTSQQQGVRIAPPARGDYRRGRPPAGDSYVPGPSRSQSRSRSRSPIRPSQSQSLVRRIRDQARRTYDHYSPPRSPSRGGHVPVPRRRSPVRQNPPPRQTDRSPPRRMINTWRRNDSPGRSAIDAPPTLLAGTKRPFEEPVAPPHVVMRRRVEEPVAAQRSPVLFQHEEPNGMRAAGERGPEGWNGGATHRTSLSSSSGVSLGSQVSVVDTAQNSLQQLQQGRAEDEDASGPALASRLSDEHRYGFDGRFEPISMPRSHSQQRLNEANPNNRSDPSSRWNSPAPESASSRPGLLERFSGPVRGGHHHYQRHGSPALRDPRPARGRGGRGRGGYSQPLNNRIFSGNPNVSLLDRIQD